MKRIIEILNKEGVRYLIIGGLTTLVNVATFYILVEWGRLNVNISNIISIIVAIIFAFLANKFIVFQSKSKDATSVAKEFAKFIFARGLTMIIEVGGVYLLYEIIHLHSMVAKIITQIVVIILNYVLSKKFVFEKGRAKS